MNLSQANILFIARQMGDGGTEKVILQLCEILKPKVRHIVVCSSGGAQVLVLEKMGIAHYIIPDFSNKSVCSMLATLCALHSIIKKERITLIHAHARLGALYARICGKRFHIPVVATAHNVFSDKRLLTRFAYHAMPVIACGKSVYDNLIGYYGLPKKNVSLISNSVADICGEMVPLPEIQEHKGKDNFVIAFFGRLSKVKAVDVLIRAMATEKMAKSSVRLFIVGDGEERESLQALVQSLGVQHSVCFLGYRTNVQNIMRQIDLCVQTSVIEGLPLALIEAMSASLPIVATDIPGTNDVVIDGYNGKLVPVNSPALTADAILFFANHPEQRKIFGKNARTRYEEAFSYQQFSEKYKQFYENLRGKK